MGIRCVAARQADGMTDDGVDGGVLVSVGAYLKLSGVGYPTLKPWYRFPSLKDGMDVAMFAAVGVFGLLPAMAISRDIYSSFPALNRWPENRCCSEPPWGE